MAFSKKYVLIGEIKANGRVRQNIYGNKFYGYHKKADAQVKLDKLIAKGNHNYKLALITIFEYEKKGA